MGVEGAQRMRRASEPRRVLVLAYEQCGREGPEVMFVFSAVAALSTASLVILDQGLGWRFGLANLLAVAAWLAGAAVIRWRLVGARWYPSVTAAAFVLAVLVMVWEYPIIEVAALASSLVLMSTYGAVVLTWPPFAVGGAVMLLAMVPPAMAENSVTDVDWIGIQASALFVSAVLLWVRRRALVRLALAKDTIEHLATHDQLTGLLNRHGLETALPLLTGMARRDGQHIFTVFVDISGLKVVNDSHGHLAGDAVISATARAVSAVSREADLVTRWGGDEFLIVGIGDAPDARLLSSRILSAIDVAEVEGWWVPGVGVGAAGRPDADLDELVHEADAAMYRGRRGA